jgi:hypothetical protein
MHSLLIQRFAKIDHPFGFYESEPGMCRETVVVINVNIGRKLPAALLPAPFLRCAA